jgi:hypothetical protein
MNSRINLGIGLQKLNASDRFVDATGLLPGNDFFECDEMNRRLPSLLFVSISWLTATSAGPNEPKLTPERFASLHALISPHPGEEKWLEIHWLTNLTEARHQAEAQNKPILLWEMDGNPLGCT